MEVVVTVQEVMAAVVAERVTLVALVVEDLEVEMGARWAVVLAGEGRKEARRAVGAVAEETAVGRKVARR
jgi:hypothetical protein